MRLVVIDFESYFDDEFTLKKLSTEEYIRDPRFIAHGAAIKWSKDHAAIWYDEPRLRQVLKDEDWSDVFLIAHHAQFDHFILSQHYSVVPRMCGCTLSMARLLLGNHISVSLDSVRKQFGLPAKSTPYNLFKGKHWHELTAQEQQALAEGCCDEVESIWTLFGFLAKDFPSECFEMVDQTIRMFTQPMLRGDIDLLAKIWETEQHQKASRQAALDVTSEDLQSSDRFQALLEAEGVEIEYKNGKNGPIPAFAKTDSFMEQLLEHDNERVRALAEARLGQKSTFLQTRAETYAWMERRGSLPVYLRFAGTGTLRPSGSEGNFLNLKRGSDIRRAILAPKGYLLGPVDSAQLELRVGAWLSGNEKLLETLRNKGDPYADTASLFYNERVYKPKKDDSRRDEMEMKRGAGKQAQLMCLGPETLVLTDNGIKPILKVELKDRLWDGVEWVKHQGLLVRGTQTVIRRMGVHLTTDHGVLCGNTWIPAQKLKGSTVFHALVTGTASLSSQAMKSVLMAAFSLWRPSVRAVAPNVLLTYGTSLREERRGAANALANKLAIGLNNTTDTLMFARKNRIDDVSWDALALFITDAIVNQPYPMPIMGAEEFKYIHHGKKIVAPFWRIWSRYRDGINRNWKSIGSIIKAAMFLEIFVLPQKVPISETVESFGNSKMKLPTYDIACAGPRNRFTIVCSAGALIVHNCQYGAAADRYRATARAGLYGPKIDMTLEEAARHVKLYRDSNSWLCAPNSGYWAQCGRIISRLAGGDPLTWGIFQVKDKRIYLPNGMPLIYDTLEYHYPDAEEPCKDFERKGYWRMRTRQGWKKMWGSRLFQNLCEAVAVTIVYQAMVRCARMGYRALNHPYDELLFLIPNDGHAEEHLERCRLEMCKTPDWLPGLPLEAEALLGERYSK